MKCNPALLLEMIESSCHVIVKMKISFIGQQKLDNNIYTDPSPSHPPWPVDTKLSSRGIDFLLTKQVTPRDPDQKFTRSSISRRALT